MEVYSLNLALFALAIIVAVLGAYFGSFCSKIVFRLEGERMSSVSLVSPSICPNCIKKLELRDKIPIISYFLLRGKCRRCGAPITKRYLVLEIIGMILPFILVLMKNFDVIVIADYFFVMAILCDLFISYDGYRLPVLLSYFILVLALFIASFQQIELLKTLLTFIISYLPCHIYLSFLKKDIRSTTTLLFAAVCSYLGFYSGAIIFGAFIILTLLERFLIYLNNWKKTYYIFTLTLIILTDFFFKDYILGKVIEAVHFILN